MSKLLFRIMNFIGKGLLSFLLILLLYFVAALAGSNIPVNSGNQQTEGIKIYLRTDGAKMSFVLPLKNEVTNWSRIAPPENTSSKRADFSYVSFSWGDLDDFRNPSKGGSFPVAFRSVYQPGPSAIHVQFLQQLRFNKPMVPVYLSPLQYKQLSEYILNSFRIKEHVLPQPLELHYNEDDTFYPARRSVHFFYNANTWVNNGLKKADLPACLWTPFDEGIFNQYH